jgi:hypothetical protein
VSIIRYNNASSLALAHVSRPCHQARVESSTDCMRSTVLLARSQPSSFKAITLIYHYKTRLSTSQVPNMTAKRLRKLWQSMYLRCTYSKD